jgi:hypothetical protein
MAGSPLSHAETVRVATWSFPAPTDGSPNSTTNLDKAGAALKKLNPDVILLDGVRGWQMCAALAQALKPAEYTVLSCSAFREAASGTAVPQQVAILSKHKGYFSWSEAWKVEGAPAPAGGFAFAAVQFGKQRVGFFSTRMEGQSALLNDSSVTRAALSRQWAQTVASFRSWVNNRLGAIVVAGGEVAPGSREANSILRFLSEPLAEPVAMPEPSSPAESSGRFTAVPLAADPERVPAVLLSGPPAACELDLDAPKPKAAIPVQPKVLSEVPTPRAPAPIPTPQPAPTLKPQPPTFDTRPLYPWAGAAALLGLGWYWASRRRALARAMRALPAVGALPRNGVSSYTLVVTPQSLTHSASAPVAPSQIPQRVPQLEGYISPASQVEAWPPGPVLFESQRQREAALNRAGLLLHLRQWLKQKLVQRLIADRAGLLKTQKAATEKLLSFEERLARMERQLQQQNRAYEARIEQLNEDLLAAKEENRELIRARIAQVKAEMESARARLLAQAGAARGGSGDTE